MRLLPRPGISTQRSRGNETSLAGVGIDTHDDDGVGAPTAHGAEGRLVLFGVDELAGVGTQHQEVRRRSGVELEVDVVGVGPLGVEVHPPAPDRAERGHAREDERDEEPVEPGGER